MDRIISNHTPKTIQACGGLSSLKKELESNAPVHPRYFLNKKPNSWPSTKSFLISGHCLVLKTSLKFLNLVKKIAVKAYAECECSKLFVL